MGEKGETPTTVGRWKGFAWTNNEVSRVAMAAVALCHNLYTVASDWDFPDFDSQDVKIIGTDLTAFHMDVFRKYVDRLPAWFVACFNIYIPGKWFNYSMCIMGFFLDFNYLYACLIYRPCDFGISYTDNGQQYV